ncbi:hypothetical protein BDV38DRAFT_266102 [Aspergillus pseudotamarii]|uniref:Tubby C-terminal-like domain-containing protein n=1 Tax=Aspergillus pseudotamarii TaxID=132259 RepID=A0A5N6S852_ASPPS|nr:uncharacterized protein BDV38DRAFT_266102 [Aspergillus pseudotamarii]KAE8130848.1 hypothetical protein BDV38DRAFT_266102 [Aspergillus pseudotamarii]
MDSKLESKDYATSIHSVASSTSTLLDTSKANFLEGRRFHIEAKGIRAIRPPMPMRQNEIPIYTADGTLAYTATKDKALSSHTILASPKHGDLFSIDFRPGCSPWIRFLPSVEGDVIPPIALQGKLTTRTMSFTPPEGGCKWEWKYSTIASPDGAKLKALCLEKIDEAECAKVTQIAYLLRGPDARATGSSCCSAGNGGQLVISLDVDLSMVEEALIIATCLVMLRRERDRRRFIQAMVIGGMGS